MIDITFSSRKQLPVVAGFSTRQDFWEKWDLPQRTLDEKNAARETFVEQLTGKKDVAYLKQVYGTDLHKVEETGLFPKPWDALWTDQKELPLSVSVSDCVPLLCYLNHEEKPAIGVIHLSRHCAHAGLVKKTFDTRAAAWYDIGRMYVWMWPSICQDNYEFGEEAMELFGDDYCSMAMWKTYLDLRWYIIDQIRELGVGSSHIRYHAACTFDDDSMFSYRRDWKTWKSMFWVIMLK